jgi:uncharacterized phage protein gp47/JayE
MINLGNPFSQPYQVLIDSLEESLRLGVEQPAVDRFTFQSSISAYELRLPAYAITRVSGLMGGTVFTIFTPEVHFRFSNNRIIWLHSTEKPLDGGRLEVEYIYRERPSGLTDFNPGSVTGTLLRAFARELKLLYEQMDQAYQRAFIDHANGVALDNVVALLGIQRNPPIPAEGVVLFFRKKAADQPYPIPQGTRVADESGRTFLTTAPGTISNTPIEQFLAPNADQLVVLNRIAELTGVWASSSNPDSDPSLLVVIADPKLPFGEAENTITMDISGGPLPAGELRVRYVAKSVTLPVIAVQPGPEGNVNANTITIMPTPPTGIQGVTNPEPTAEGKEAETDEQLRERAKHHLERLGNATLNAIKFAVLDVDGVEGVEVTDHTLDSSIPLGEVHVSFSGGDVAEVSQMVEDTRAAGVMAVLTSIEEVLVSGEILVLPDVAVPTTAVASFESVVLEAIRALEIGKPLSVKKLAALVYGISGLADVAEAHLASSGVPISDPFVVARTKLIRPDEANLHVRLLSGLHVANVSRAAPTNQIDVQVQTESGPATFVNYTLNLTLTFRARLKTAPDQLPAFIGSLSRQATYSGGTTAQISFDDGDIPGYDSSEHDPEIELTITAAAYPGLPEAKTTVNLV